MAAPPVRRSSRTPAGTALVLRIDNRDRFREALRSDLGRPPAETNFMELNQVVNHAIAAYDNVEKWAKPEYTAFNVIFFDAKLI